MNEFNKRILEVAEYYGITKPVDFAKKTGFSHQVSSNYLKGERTPTAEALLKIKQTFDINADWLLTGQGTMHPDTDTPTSSLTSLPASSTAVPFYNIPVSAGPLGVLTYSRDALKPDGYIDIDIFRRCDAILPVMGVSMEPEIHSGDLIGIKKLEYYNWEYIQTGKIYMIITHEDRMIKYISKADDSEYIVCSSPNYHDFKVRKDDVLEIYRVIASIKSF